MCPADSSCLPRCSFSEGGSCSRPSPQAWPPLWECLSPPLAPPPLVPKLNLGTPLSLKLQLPRLLTSSLRSGFGLAGRPPLASCSFSKGGDLQVLKSVLPPLTFGVRRSALAFLLAPSDLP